MLIIVTIPIVCNGTFNASVSFGGTSIVIVVGVVIESVNQVKGKLSTYTQKGFLSKF